MAARRYGALGVHSGCSPDLCRSHVGAAVSLELLLEVGGPGSRNLLVHPHLRMEPVVGLEPQVEAIIDFNQSLVRPCQTVSCSAQAANA